MTKSIVLAALGILAPLIVHAGGGPHEKPIKCHPARPDQMTPRNFTLPVVSGIVPLKNSKDRLLRLSLTETFYGKLEGECNPIIVKLGSSAYALIAEVSSTQTYEQIDAKTYTIDPQNVITAPNSTRVTGLRVVDGSSTDLTYNCSITAVPSGFQDLATITGALEGVPLNMANLPCTHH